MTDKSKRAKNVPEIPAHVPDNSHPGFLGFTAERTQPLSFFLEAFFDSPLSTQYSVLSLGLSFK